jgi:hypothetical protein
VRRHLYGEHEYYIFVRHLVTPTVPPVLPAETKGLVVRRIEAEDLHDLDIRRCNPAAARTAAGDVLVAVRQGRVVGAAWYLDTVTPLQPWYRVVEPHLIRPARFTENIFVRPGEGGAGWALAKMASDVLGAAGVRSIVGMVGCDNKPSILLGRLLGGRIVGRMQVRYRLGHRTVLVEAVRPDDEAAFGTARTASPNRHTAPDV